MQIILKCRPSILLPLKWTRIAPSTSVMLSGSYHWLIILLSKMSQISSWIQILTQVRAEKLLSKLKQNTRSFCIISNFPNECIIKSSKNEFCDTHTLSRLCFFPSFIILLIWPPCHCRLPNQARTSILPVDYTRLIVLPFFLSPTIPTCSKWQKLAIEILFFFSPFVLWELNLLL
jgi:hypothetical protein